MAWGRDCTSWDDSVDWANLAAFDYGDIPDDDLVMTSWHEDETLAETFWFAAHLASHSEFDLQNLLIVDITAEGREHDILEQFRAAEADDEGD